MAWAIITNYTSKSAQMDPQQLPKTSKFYSKCKKCDIEKTLGGWVPLHPLVARSNPITMQNVPTLSQSQQRYDGMILKTCSTYNYLVARTRGQNKVPVVLKCRAFRWMIFNSIGYSRPTCEIRFLVSFGGSSYGSIHPGLSSSGRRTGMW